MKKLIILFILFTSFIWGQLKNVALESKFEKDVLKEIELIQNKQKSKSNVQIFRETKPKSIALDKDLRVLCRVRLNENSSKIKLISLGCEIKNETHNDVYVWIPIDKIEDVAALKEVLSIGSKGYVITNNSIISAGTSLHRTNLVYSTYGLTGYNLKVGVISDGMKYATVSQNNNELPYYVDAVDYTNDTTNYPGSEGTAMMEIIHDIAPSSALWFGGINGSDTPLDFANRVIHLKQKGCKIIVDDLSFIWGYSYFQENEISAAIRQFINDNNGCYISSAGNHHGKVYAGSIYTVASDKSINFNGTTNELTFTSVDTGYIQITFQWADDWYYPLDDYDIYVYDNNNNLKYSGINRGYGYPPEEHGGIHVTSPNSTYKIKVKWYSYTPASTNREIKIALWGGSFNFPLATKENEILGHQITDEIIGTAATRVTDSLNVEYFSANGPAKVYTSSGTISDIQQPKITAADSVDTFVGVSGNFYNPFSGTSAAAPHVAGIAALYFQMFPTDSYLNFKQSICNSSVTMNDGGSSNNWKKGSGYGRIDAYNAIQYRYNQNFVTIKLNQKNSSGVNVDSALVWQSNKWNIFSVPDSFVLQKGTTSYFKSKQSILIGEKYHDWNGLLTDVTNYRSFTIPNQSGSFTANLLPTNNNIQIKNVLLENTSLNGGNVGFRDPWLIDTSDSKGTKNRGTITSARWYYNLNSPFCPDYSTQYNGHVYKGLFLNQPIISGKPYYSVKVDAVQSIDLGGTIGTRDFYFLNWSAYPPESAEFQNADALETPVVFKSDGATVQANYKGHLLTNSSTATSQNNQRKIVQGSNGYWAMVYVSMNQVWLSRSTDGVNWDREILISDYDNGYVNGYPSIDFYNDYTYIVWQSISWIGISGWNLCDINIRRYDLTNNILGPIITAASFEPNIEAFISAPVIAYPGGKDNEITIAWREPNGIKIKDGRGQLGADNITWSSTFNVPNTNAYSTNPSIAYACGYDFALCWAHSYGGNKIYYSTATKTYSPEWTFSNTAIISPSDWESNVSPQITVINRYKPTIVWTSRNNIVEGGPSVHIRQRSGLGTNDTWGTITSFSHPNSSSSLSPIIGDYYGLTKMEVLWNIGSTVYKASYNGTSWSGPTTLTTSGGSGVNINRTTAYQSKALWKKSDNTIAFYNVGGTTPPAKIVAGLENEESKLPYRLNRHAVIELSKDIDEQALGSVCFEIAGISTVYKEAETKINYSVDENNLLCSEPIKISAPGMQLSFAGAIYGSGLELPDKFISTLNEPLAKVVLKDSKANVVLQNIWTNNAAMLNQVQNKTFGEFRNVFIDLNKYLGKTVYVQVEMLGKAKDLKPLIVDDYLILTDSLSISKSLGKKNLTAYELPTDYTLMQNYPNPFNPVTTISFFIPQNNYVTLKIYNTLGEEVMTAINEDMEEGYHSVNLNLSAMPSGVYLYSLSAGSFRDTKKLLLLK